MPRKKKTANEMTDAELLRRVFPERVAKAIEEEIREDEPEPDNPSKDRINDVLR